HQLAVHTIAALQRRLDQYKRGHGLMSFEDMLTRMDQGLDPAHNPGAATLVGLLRRRFRYAIVDEFQDTDPVQWRILQRLFLEGGEGRLFVVGDPKQAIFNFRGADLDTYLVAKMQLAKAQDATVCTLDTNWRSSTELVAALNHVFAHGDWFAKPLAFSPVRPATNPAKRSAFVDQESDRAALTLVRIGGDETLARARRH